MIRRYLPSINTSRGFSSASSKTYPKIALFSDIHFAENGLERVEKTADWIHSEVQSRNCTHGICLGDVLNTRESVSVRALSSALNFFDAFTIPIDILLGNHDLNLKSSSRISSLDALSMKGISSAQQIRLHRNPTLYSLSKFLSNHHNASQLPDLEFLMLPYIEDPAEIRQFLSTHVPRPQNTVIFGHLSIAGAYRRKNALYTAHTPSPSSSTQEKHQYSSSALSPSDFAPFHRVFSGHFHHSHSVPGTNGRVQYVGSPMQHHFGDSGDEKRGMLIYEPAEDKIEFIQNPEWDAFRTVVLDEKTLNSLVPSVLSADASTPSSLIDESKLTKKKRKSKKDIEEIAKMEQNKETEQQEFVKKIDSILGFSVNGKYISIAFDSPLMAHQYDSIASKLLQCGALMVRRHVGPSAERSFVSLSLSSDQLNALQHVSHEELPTADASSVLKPSDRFSEIIDPYLAQCLVSEASPQLRSDLAEYGRKLISDAESDEKLDHDNVVGLHSSTFNADLKSITMENFLGVQGKMEVNFDALPDGVILIKGPNGTGKSSLFEAVTWCLFDSFLRSDMRADDCINEVVGKNCLVRLEFSNGYTIERFRKHKGFGSTPNGFRVYLNGQRQDVFEAGDPRAAQKRLEALLGVDFSAFSRSAVVGESTATGAGGSFVRSDAATRRCVLEDMTGLSRFDLYLEKTKKEMKRVEAEITRLRMQQDSTQRTISTYQREVETAALEYESAKKSADGCKTELQKLEENTLLNLKFDLWKNQTKLSKLMEYRSKSSEDAVRLAKAERLTQVEQDLAESEKQLETVRTQRNDFKIVEDNLASLKLLSQQEEEAKSLMLASKQRCVDMTEEYSRAEAELKMALDTNQCPTCERPLEAEMKSDLQCRHPRLLERRKQALDAAKEEAAKKREEHNAIVVKVEDLVRPIAHDLRIYMVDKELAASQRAERARRLLDEIISHEGWISQLRMQETMYASVVDNHRRQREALAQALASFSSTSSAFTTPIPSQFTSISISSSELFEFAWTAADISSDYEKNKQQLSETVSTLTSSIDDCNQRIQTEAVQLATFEERARAQDNIRTLTQAAITELNARMQTEILSQLQTMEKELLPLSVWLNAFDRKISRNAAVTQSMRSYLMTQAVETLNSVILEYSHALGVTTARQENAGDSSSSAAVLQPLRFAPDLSVESQTGFGKRSAGQRKRMELSVLFALFELVRQRSRFRSDFLMLDEVADGLDDQGQQDMSALLQALSSRVRKILVVSHSPRMHLASRCSIDVRMSEYGTMMKDSAGSNAIKHE